MDKRLERIDARIARYHDAELRAYWACQDELAGWYVFRIQRLQHLKMLIERQAAEREA
jgi:hypothetical protein